MPINPLLRLISPLQYHNHDTSSSHSTFSANAVKKGPISPPPLTKSRTVSFSLTSEVRPTICLSDYTEEERQNTWGTTEELTERRMERKLLVRVMEKVDPRIDDGNKYYRGLENKTRQGLQRKKFNVIDASMSVLEEQTHQLHIGNHDPEAIARAYASCTSHCAEEALQRAIIDEAAARKAAS